MRRDITTAERLGAFSDGMIAVIIPIMVAIYAAIFVLINCVYLFFERETLAQAYAAAMSIHTCRLARRRSLAGLTIFGPRHQSRLLQ
jgi:hypothetical protein